jgi:hypothetical protein
VNTDRTCMLDRAGLGLAKPDCNRAGPGRTDYRTYENGPGRAEKWARADLQKDTSQNESKFNTQVIITVF